MAQNCSSLDLTFIVNEPEKTLNIRDEKN